MIVDKTSGDIDIDLGDRSTLLQYIEIIPAAIRDDKGVKKHPTGVYPTEIPFNPIDDLCSLDYRIAEKRGYLKLDLLNVSIYKLVKDENHLIELMNEPKWSLLKDRSIFEQLIHIGRHYEAMCSMPEPVDSIPRMAMFLALIRPAKKHLIGQPWKKVSETVWEKNDDEGYAFRKSHAIAYAQLVVIHLNLLTKEVA